MNMEMDRVNHNNTTAKSMVGINNFTDGKFTGQKENVVYSFWQTLVDPNKLFPQVDPLISTIIYIGVILLFALLLLLLVWVTAVWCHESKVKKKRRRFQSSLIHRDLFPHTLSSFGSVGCLSTATTSSYGSLSSLVKSQKNGTKMGGSLPRHCTHSSRFQPESHSGSNDNRYATSNFSTKKQIKKVKSMTEKSTLLRGSSVQHHSHDSFLNQCPSHASNTSSCPDGLCRDCMIEACLDRPCELPRANWDGEKMLTFIREQSKKQQTTTPSYGTMKENEKPPPPLTNAIEISDDEFPPPPLFTL